MGTRVVGGAVGVLDGTIVGDRDVGLSVGDSVGRRVTDSALESKLLPTMYMKVRLLEYVPYKAPLTQIFEHSLASLESRLPTPQKLGNEVTPFALREPLPAPQQPSSLLNPRVVEATANLDAVMAADLLKYHVPDIVYSVPTEPATPVVSTMR